MSAYVTILTRSQIISLKRFSSLIKIKEMFTKHLKLCKFRLHKQQFTKPGGEYSLCTPD